MKRSAAWTVSILLAMTGASGACFAAEASAPAGSPAAVLGALAGTAVPAAQLGKERARGALGIFVDGSGSALATANSTNNSVDGGAATARSPTIVRSTATPASPLFCRILATTRLCK